MLTLPTFARRAAALALLALLCVGAAPAPALPAAVAGDVQESYRLLTSTYYTPIDPQVLLAAAADALSELAHKHGVTVVPPTMQASGGGDAATSALDAGIASVAQQAHGAPTDYAYAAIVAMAKAVGDRYTMFFTPAQFKAFNDELDPQKISGIGVMIEPDSATKFIRVSYVVPSTPADRAGLLVGDLITSVNAASTKGLKVQAASKLLRGKPGSSVAVVVQRDGAPNALDFSIERAEVQPPTVVFKMLPGSVGYVYIYAFGKATPQEFDTAIARLKAQGAKALVLDLRNDGGGYVDSALRISSRFIANRALVTVEERGHRPATIRAGNDTSVAIPVTVLVNQYTASASEITAGALQDDGIGTLIGTKTFGKGVMQTLTPLPDGAAIKITTAHYLTPSHRDINLRGINPDVRIVENHDARFGETGHDAQLRAALSFLQKKIAQAKP